jgi:hypothetical protein
MSLTVSTAESATMKNSLTLVLGAMAGVFAATHALADQTWQGRPGTHSGTSQSNQSQSHASAPHFQQSAPREQFYRPNPGSSGHAFQPSQGAPQYRGQSAQHYNPAWRGQTVQHGTVMQQRGYAPGSWAHNYDRSHVTVSRSHATAFRAFSSFRGRNVSNLGAREREMWRGGEWRHARHNGRYGWWWNVDGGWFFYDEPVYPYPAYISDYAYDDYDDGDYGNNVAYWCDWPRGYYPDVQYCSVQWQQVPAGY